MDSNGVSLIISVVILPFFFTKNSFPVAKIGLLLFTAKPSQANSGISRVIDRVFKKIYVAFIAMKLPGPRTKKSFLQVYFLSKVLMIEGKASEVFSS